MHALVPFRGRDPMHYKISNTRKRNVTLALKRMANQNSVPYNAMTDTPIQQFSVRKK